MRDKDIRTALHERIIPPRSKAPGTRVIDELGICQGAARIDIAIIDGKLHGFEIKSERDSLERLPAQKDLYSKVFDTVTLVINDNHLDKSRKIIPAWWGLIRVSGSSEMVELESERPAQFRKTIRDRQGHA